MAPPKKTQTPIKKKTPKKKSIKKKIKASKPSLFVILGKIFLGLSIWGAFGVGLIFLWFSKDFPSLDNLDKAIRQPSITFQSRDGYIIGTYGDLYEEVLSIDKLPPYVPQALMAVEDRRFYYHFGVDIIGLVRAAYKNYKHGRVVEGGSTITQQLAKNFLMSQGLFKTTDRSIKRKIQEVMLSLWLEWNFTKDEILTMYLNRVYFGSGTFGVDAASYKYFGKSARTLSVFEACVLAGLLKAPSRYTPAANPEKAAARAKTVLHLMKRAGFIRHTDSYYKEGLESLKKAKKQRGSENYRYFSDWAYEELSSVLGSIDQDVVVITTLDYEMQKHASYVLNTYLNEMKWLKATQGMFLSMTPQGAVRVMLGGRNYQESQFNRVTQALRQPGSVFKPLVYLTALENDYTVDSMIDDSPYETEKWKPKNYYWKSRGEVDLLTGLAYSINAVSIRLTESVTPEKVIETSRRLGIDQYMLPTLSLALGAMETTMIQLVSAFGVFANKGYPVHPYAIEEVRSKSGNLLYKRPHNRLKRLVAPEHVRSMRQLLRNVVQGKGWGGGARVGDGTVSGKSGSNGDRDAWFIGYRDPIVYKDGKHYQAKGYANLIAGCWIGNDNNTPMHEKSTGGRLPARVVSDFFKGRNRKLRLHRDFKLPFVKQKISTKKLDKDIPDLIDILGHKQAKESPPSPTKKAFSNKKKPVTKTQKKDLGNILSSF